MYISHLFSKANFQNIKIIAGIFLFFGISINVKSQITATTPNKYFSIVNFDYFAMPTVTDALLVGTEPLQVVIATTPSPTLNWDDNIGNIGSLPITGFSGTVFLDDVVLLKPVSSSSVIALISARVMQANNTTDIILIKASWNGNNFSLIGSTLIDNRNTNSDWFDGVRLSIDERGAESSNRQQIIMVWQKGGEILLNEGYYYFATNIINWYNSNISAFNGLSGTFKHPDISKKNYVAGYINPSIANIVAIQSIGNTHNLINFGYSSEEANPSLVAIYTPTFLTLHSTNGLSESLRTPRVLNSLYGSVAIVNKLDNLNKKSFLLTIGNVYGSLHLFNSNQDLESVCTNNEKYKYTGFPSIELIQRSDPHSATLSEDFAVTWQQIDCAGSDFCGITALSKRYHHRSANPGAPNAWYSLFNDQFFYISTDLSRNTVFPSVAAIPNITTGPPGNPATYCSNFYSFGILDNVSNLNGQIGYKKTDCNSTTLFSLISKAVESNISQSSGSENRPNASKKDEGLTMPTVKVYPNPVRDILSVKINENELLYKIEIYDVMGVLTHVTNITSGYSKQVRVDHLANGYYYIRLYTKNNVIRTQKIAIIH